MKDGAALTLAKKKENSSLKTEGKKTYESGTLRGACASPKETNEKTK